jgi:hypothetical protein
LAIRILVNMGYPLGSWYERKKPAAAEAEQGSKNGSHGASHRAKMMLGQEHFPGLSWQ